MKRKCTRFLLILLTVLLLFGAAAGIYVNDYYHADREAICVMTNEMKCTCSILDDGIRVYEPEGEWDTALIFYPGGKVECDAYEPLMVCCAEAGVACILVEMPWNLAVLDMDAAEGIHERYPDVVKWYLGGHSLGGSMAASFTSDAQWVDGLILLAAYSTADVSDVPVLSIYGSEDGVMNQRKYEKYRSNLSGDLTEVVIEGGNHAGFGMYGHQKGDGEASIPNAEQIALTAEYIAAFVK